MAEMGFGDTFSKGGLDTACFKFKYRWLFKINDIISSGINAIPPSKGSRPGFTFKEMQVEHLNETIFFPSKTEWKPINLTLYDLKKNKHPIFEWIKLSYNPCNEGTFSPSIKSGGNGLKKNATLELLNGCGDIIETWKLDNCYPISAEFGDLDYSVSEIVMVDISLRYDRAYLSEEC